MAENRCFRKSSENPVGTSATSRAPICALASWSARSPLPLFADRNSNPALDRNLPAAGTRRSESNRNVALMRQSGTQVELLSSTHSTLSASFAFELPR
jgi:hypothetical protein